MENVLCAVAVYIWIYLHVGLCFHCMYNGSFCFQHSASTAWLAQSSNAALTSLPLWSGEGKGAVKVKAELGVSLLLKTSLQWTVISFPGLPITALIQGRCWTGKATAQSLTYLLGPSSSESYFKSQSQQQGKFVFTEKGLPALLPQEARALETPLKSPLSDL